LSRSGRDAYLELIRGHRRGFAAALARSSLSVASVGYRTAMAFRNWGYDRGWLRVHRVPVPVVSVGNLTVGGTGKTPMVEWVARWCRRRAKRVVILSRGYGQIQGLNDEGRVLEENLPDVPHLQDPDRVRSAGVAVEQLEAELLLLDDGFQHRRLARDLDIVLLDALEPWGLRRLLPRGLLREPAESLWRADVVVLSRADLIPPIERSAIRAGAERRAGLLRWVEARHAPLGLIDSEGEVVPLVEIAGRPVAAFCGIGNPEGFRRTLLPLCGSLLDLRIFPDHHDYVASDVESLAAWAQRLGADLVLTTQKDLVKLRCARLGPASLRAVKIGLEILTGDDVMEDALACLLKAPPD
jgi:tetraacyldisaccharide 4'-kinase